ncbi:MAG: hypothetical protein Tsb0021_09110 [Chlamydiales bacterium]
MLWYLFDRCIYWIKPLNKDPILWSGENFHVVKFGIWTSLGTFVSAFAIFFYLDCRGYPLSQSVWPYFILGGCAIWLFARLGHLINLGNRFFEDPKRYLKETSLYNQWGLIAGFLLTCLAIWRLNLPLPIALDAFAVGTCMGLFFGRIGCYVYGCCWGKETHADFGVIYKHELTSVVRQKPQLRGKKLYPTQLLAAFYNLFLFVLFMFMLFFSAPLGSIFLTFLLLHQGGRLYLEVYRDDMELEGERNLSTVYMASIFLIIGLMFSINEYLGRNVLISNPVIHHKSLLSTSLWDTLTNLYVWEGAFSISIVMGVLYSFHGKELGSW